MRILPKILRDRPFTYREACQHGLTQYAVRKFLECGVIERIERGLYRAVGEDLVEEELYRRAIKKVGKPAVVCLLSALSYYELTDTIPKNVWIMVPAQKRVTSLNVKLFRTRNPKWKVGVVVHDGFSITSIERTIVDALTVKSIASPRLGIDALKQAIAEKKTSIGRILKISNEFGVRHRILPYVEGLL
jgi:predicted transcriptional regulator of viral defense system